MPSHPELLDWLALEFVQNSWSLKSLHRLIVTSSTYRRAGRHTEPGWSEATQQVAKSSWQIAMETDPANELLAHFPRRRLEGEVVRDAMLAVSGSLNLEGGGPGAMPPLPPEMLKTLLKNQWKAAADPSQHNRRSVYVFARRNLRYPIFEAFDRPDANASCSCRNESTTATQSLLMLNSDRSFLAAKRLAHDCLAEENGDTQEAAARAILKCFGRAVTAQERDLIKQFFGNDSETRQPATPMSTLTKFCLGVLNANEFIYVD